MAPVAVIQWMFGDGSPMPCSGALTAERSSVVSARGQRFYIFLGPRIPKFGEHQNIFLSGTVMVFPRSRT